MSDSPGLTSSPLVQTAIVVIVLGIFAMYVSERYGWVEPAGRSTIVENGNACGKPRLRDDGRYVLDGHAYRMTTPPKSSSDLLCGNGKSAFWKTG